MTTTPRRSPVQGMRRGVLVSGLAGTAVLTAAGALTKGADGAMSALAGSLLAFVVIFIGLIAISLIVSGDPGVSMAGAGVVYLGQLILLVAAIGVLREATWLEGTIAAASAAASTVILQVGLLAGYVRSRHVIYPQGVHA